MLPGFAYSSIKRISVYFSYYFTFQSTIDYYVRNEVQKYKQSGNIIDSRRKFIVQGDEVEVWRLQQLLCMLYIQPGSKLFLLPFSILKISCV